MNYPIIQTTYCHVDKSKFVVTTGQKSKKTGASEFVVFARMLKLGLDDIRNDVRVTIAGHSYEPDFAYIDEGKGIYVDIEIDEPYSTNHRPTHYVAKDGMHADKRRNDIFTGAGWVVCRFTERQMFCQTKSCMKVVYELLMQMGAIDAIPKKLVDAPALASEPCWNEYISKKRSYERYRKTYLGYEPVDMDLGSYMRCCILFFQIMFQSIFDKRVRRIAIAQIRRLVA